MATQDDSTPEITYPTPWEYRIVGSSEVDIRAHVYALLGDVDYELVLGRRSSAGKYVSLHLNLVVHDEAQRLGIYDHLRTLDTIRFVV